MLAKANYSIRMHLIWSTDMTVSDSQGWAPAPPTAPCSHSSFPSSACCDFFSAFGVNTAYKLHEVMVACVYRCCDNQPFSEPKLGTWMQSWRWAFLSSKQPKVGFLVNFGCYQCSLMHNTIPCFSDFSSLWCQFNNNKKNPSPDVFVKSEIFNLNFFCLFSRFQE